MGRVLIVQEVVTHWSKASRGAPGAVARNGVPDTLVVPVPGGLADPFTVVVHHSDFPEARAFKKVNESVSLAEPTAELTLGCVWIVPDPELTQVTYHYDFSGGLPERWSQPRSKCLSVGEWGQVLYNGRFSLGWHCFWSYTKRVVNVGLFEHPVQAAFDQSPAKFRMDNRALLL